MESEPVVRQAVPRALIRYSAMDTPPSARAEPDGAPARPLAPAGLALFLRYPEPGTVKSRLQEALGAERAARFYWECALLVMAKAQRLKETEVFAFYRPEERGREIEALVMGRFGKFEGRFIVQRGRTIGERINHALERLRMNGFARQIVLGSDSPTLPQEALQQAVESLSSVDCVIGPTWDGSTYLIGVRAPDVRMFRDVPWGTGRELAQLHDNLAALGRSSLLLPRWHQIATPDDLPFLEAQVRHADYRRLKALLDEGGQGS